MRSTGPPFVGLPLFQSGGEGRQLILPPFAERRPFVRGGGWGCSLPMPPASQVLLGVGIVWTPGYARACGADEGPASDIGPPA